VGDLELEMEGGGELECCTGLTTNSEWGVVCVKVLTVLGMGIGTEECLSRGKKEKGRGLGCREVEEQVFIAQQAKTPDVWHLAASDRFHAFGIIQKKRG
jgi:hypothetical protein